MTPFFSICAACCDVAPYVRACLDSLVGQAFSDWECVVFAEASEDGTAEIVREYAARDGRFRVFEGPRTGSVSVSRNRGIEEARGDYVVFLDGDDSLEPDSLARLHAAIAARPGADIYPCAVRVSDEVAGREEPTRDNYPPDFAGEPTGPEATLLAERHCGQPCPMLQMNVFRRRFLLDEGLRCIPGLRRQDSEFSPRALYRAKRVVPLHEPFYSYRIRANAVGSSARGAGYFHGDWAAILRSLMAFHATVSRERGFDRRVSACWARQWLGLAFYFWFDPENVRTIPRGLRAATLAELFRDGFGDFDALLAAAPRSKRLAARWVRAFVRHPVLRGASEALFRAYFSLAAARRRNGGRA